MQIIFLIFLTVFWVIFWSFASVLIYRFYSKEWWIMTWRSHCANCNHILWTFDLFPIFSYIFLGWKCRYCKTSVSILYPILEIVMWIVFFLIWLYLVDFQSILAWNIQEILRLVFFLYIGFVIVVFSFYDILYQLIPTEILWPAILILLIMLLSSIFSVNTENFFSYFKTFENPFYSKPIFNSLLWAIFIYSFFYIQIFFPWMYYAIEKKKYNIILVQAIEYFTLPFYMLFSLFLKSDKENDLEETDEEEFVYTWMWHWDLWIAVFMWFVWGFKIAVLWLAIGYLIGAIVWIYILSVKKQRNTYIAFWPFLWVWLLLSLMYYDKIINLIFMYYV